MAASVGAPHAEVRAQLDRILGSEAFARAPQLQRFLIYAVEEALAGQADRLKEYTLGVEVFDRGAAFDPRTDPIVRVDARRLRARLDAYYAGEGAGDPIEIAFAKGGYAPRFRRRPVAGEPAVRVKPIGVAVLPLRSLGGGAAGKAFVEGLSDELRLLLARRPELRVVGQASAARFGDARRDLREIGRALGVALILEGKVRRQGAQLRVAMRLSSAADGAQVWSERYDATLADAEQLFALQDRMAQQIVEQMTPRVRELAAAQRRPTRDIAAYELYLRGQHQLQTRNPLTLRQAMGFLQEAVERDPGFSHAQAALAQAHFAAAIYLAAPPVEAMRRARELATAALTLDPGLAVAHARLAVLSAALDHNFPAAADGFARALSLNPLAAAARHERALWLLAPLGRLEEAEAELTALLDNDPYSMWLRLDFARVLLWRRRHAEAIRQLTMLLDMEPRFGAATHFLAFAYEHAGEPALARAAHERHVRQFPYPLVADWYEAACAVWDGEPKRAGTIVRRMEAAAERGPAAATVVADIHLRMGAHERAIDWLERGADERLFRVVYLAVDPDYDVLRREPRFRRLLERVGLAYRRRAAPSQPLRRNQSSSPAAVAAISARAKR